MKTKNIVSELIIFILILIWAYTFASKIFDFDTFNRQINGAYLLSSGGPYLAYFLQAIHLGIVILLIKRNWRGLGLLTSLSVMVIYTAYLIYILKFAPSIPCSCIAVFHGMNWNDQLYFNFIALAINLIGLITYSSLTKAPHDRVQTTYN
ncbi:MauE/DoxX family redox-associated membrane protein [Chryseobacterium camelliae]|uniref:MauE/DoxX family redox-associated membrane protein n=1 Tax=Chryseobacterium camelliae TaxID=1265445 RepID=UPI002865ACF6|nr:MauE/DoxX family redox-associated membrane protein [Chryseobacterium camelliae]MDR6513680.1 hypothetical protein [Chryseobacterium camelliae]